ncbi:MAG: PH domain-containing protein [Nocardioides sp.]
MAISNKLLTDGESVVVDTRTHPKALILPGLVLVVTLALAIFLDRKISNGVVSLVVWVLALVVILWWVLRPFLDWLTATYTVTTKRLITREGLISRKGHDIPLMRISDVAFDQGIVDRMLGCGTLVISDASTHGSVRLHDIPHVELVQRKLTDLLSGTHGGQSAPADRRDDDGT